MAPASDKNLKFYYKLIIRPLLIVGENKEIANVNPRGSKDWCTEKFTCLKMKDVQAKVITFLETWLVIIEYLGLAIIQSFYFLTGPTGRHPAFPPSATQLHYLARRKECVHFWRRWPQMQNQSQQRESWLLEAQNTNSLAMLGPIWQGDHY